MYAIDSYFGNIIEKLPIIIVICNELERLRTVDDETLYQLKIAGLSDCPHSKRYWQLFEKMSSDWFPSFTSSLSDVLETGTIKDFEGQENRLYKSWRGFVEELKTMLERAQVNTSYLCQRKLFESRVQNKVK